MPGAPHARPRRLSRSGAAAGAVYAGSCTVQVSDDPGFGTFRELFATSSGGAQQPAVAGRGRCVRLLGRTRATPYGISLDEFQVHDFQVHGR
ncbi:hypothetical protein GCM10010271_40780 [Streptomyces kurssanovii]|nr:hypothetical protein GCM10010271_40780 [Streptomyces kurssanovii]